MGKSAINPAVVGKHSTDIAALKNDLGIVEDGDTATHTIAQGQYVIWQGALYTADAAIASGTTLAASGGNKNLTAVENGGLNALNGKISNTSYVQLTINSGFSAGKFIIARCGKYRVVTGSLKPTNTGANIAVVTLPAEDRPPVEITGPCTGYSLSVQSEIIISPDGIVKLNTPQGGNNNTVKFNISWLII